MFRHTRCTPQTALKAVTKAMKWGHRDQSHGTLFTRPAFLEKNSSLLLWSGVSPELRGAWCKSLNLYMFLCLQGVVKAFSFCGGWYSQTVLETPMRTIIVDRVFNPNRPQMEGLGRVYFDDANTDFSHQAPLRW